MEVWSVRLPQVDAVLVWIKYRIIWSNGADPESTESAERCWTSICAAEDQKQDDQLANPTGSGRTHKQELSGKKTLYAWITHGGRIGPDKKQREPSRVNVQQGDPRKSSILAERESPVPLIHREFNQIVESNDEQGPDLPFHLSIPLTLETARMKTMLVGFTSTIFGTFVASSRNTAMDGFEHWNDNWKTSRKLPNLRGYRLQFRNTLQHTEHSSNDFLAYGYTRVKPKVP
ncbi:hypothetical protein F5878DRAFT_640219 [Lentinula raphanica]|uniref:Uncharacterized protein n=1 Tax=Lentinula raphanica TaxID=153919 RepID=A0AA38PD06_9AGAR|nr:hypothetical protein F5880DRAFT_1734890 [Lentinula raphanica]KAJ3840634.1 hypothetical protein F5878DRAFT_640219 [Lentinula raphanica]